MRQRSFRNPETLHGKDENLPDTATLLPEQDNPPGHGGTTQLAHRKRAAPLSHWWRRSASDVGWARFFLSEP